MWRSRRWRKLLNIIDHLPRDSAYVEAMTQDEDLAEQLMSRPNPPKTPARRMSEFSPAVELLSIIADRIGEQTQVIASAHGAKPGKVRPMPRPVSAMDRVRQRRREAKHRALVARVLPGRS